MCKAQGPLGSGRRQRSRREPALAKLGRPGSVGGRLILDDRVIAGRIRIEDEWIVEVEPDDAEAAGPLLAPGFVDVHVHGWGGHDAMGPTADLDGMARALLRRGVTSFLPTAVTASLPDLATFAERVRGWLPNAPRDGAEPLGFNIEGPFISAARKGAQDPAWIRDPEATDRAELEPLLDGLLLMTVAPETPGALALIAWLRDRGVTVSAGHSAAGLDAAQAGYAAGASGTTHLFNAMSGMDHHAPGLSVAALTADDVYVELIADGHHVHPALWPIITRTKPPDRLLLVSDAVSLAGTGLAQGMIGALEVQVEGDRCTLRSTGALAGSLIALDSAVRNLVGSGLPLPRAAAAASGNPATMIGALDRGRLAVGLRADIVELDDDLAVGRVMRGGEWLSGGT
ncbi:MAG: N-acetylglucosamine-6-phosphate deacetylase [Chloroflexota bacterium]|nr:N-acetylglucosamine-6-phosphate deacetylase [Chloroflexota bacterium]